MPLIPWKAFDELERFFEEEDFFPVIPARWQRTPRMNVYETDKEVVAEFELPGIDPEKVDITLKDNILTVKGESEEKKEEKEKNYYRKEIRKGYFERSILLPVETREEEAKASYKDGVLKVTIPRKEEREVKETKIKVEKEK